YVVDGDDGGTDHARRLEDAGVDPSRVFFLGGQASGFMTETLLRSEVYLAAVNETLLRVHARPGLTLEDLGGAVTPKAVDVWCDENDLARLGKPAVASV